MKKNLFLLILIMASTAKLFPSYAQWNELVGLNGLVGVPYIYSVCADASGNIYTGGWFTNSAGNEYVAKWNGTAWSELGGLNGLAANFSISSICSDASGNIYAGGGL